MSDTCVFRMRDGWWAMFQGKLSLGVFNSKGAAEAWVAVCRAAGKWRA